MLHVHGDTPLYRRWVLKAGALGLGGLSLPGLLQARDEARRQGKPVRATSVVYIELAGGPSQVETYDPKPDAPSEFRGPFATVPTAIPGVRFCELMAEQARVADKLSVVRSIHHPDRSHRNSSHLTQTGHYQRDRGQRSNEFPCVGAVTAKLRGANARGLPPYVAVPRSMRSGGPAFLGNAYRPFEVRGNPNAGRFRVRDLGLRGGLEIERLEDRRSLLESLDSLRRMAERHEGAGALDAFHGRAFDLLTGDLARRAFAIDEEPDAVRERYGRNRTGQSVLLARRLVEAGVTFVTVRVGGWDDHQDIEKRLRRRAPAYDRAVAAFVRDLYERDLDRDVLLVAMGEFGRTPKINRRAGRDHWGSLMSVLLAGGGLRAGAVVGSSNDRAEEPVDAPYRPESILATVYRHLGIDPETTVPDLAGRPRYLLDERTPVRELL